MRQFRPLALIVFLVFLAFPSIGQGFYIGVHYFEYSSALTFWNSFEWKNVRQDFQKIKGDGFNTILLVVPWGEFQTGVKPVTYNEKMFTMLKQMIDLAAEEKLDVLLRLGYLWYFDPESQLTPQERQLKFFYDDNIHKAWLEYLAKVHHVVADCPNVKYGFISWEDNYLVVERHNKSPEPVRIQIAKDLGYQRFLQKKININEYNQQHQSRYASWEEVPIPRGQDADYPLFLEFADDLLLNRLFKPSQKVYPGLTMEVRVDYDPYRKKDGSISWFSHEATYDVPQSDRTVIYYAPFMGAENKGELLSAERGLELFKYLLSRVQKYTKQKKIFVDQFNILDNTPGAEKNAQIDPKELPRFMEALPAILVQQTEGFAYWGSRNQRLNAIYNGSFEIGLRGWHGDGQVTLEARSADNHRAHLTNGARMYQSIPSWRLGSCYMLGAEGTLTLNIQGTPGAKLHLEFAGNPHVTARVVDVPAEERTISVSVPAQTADVTVGLRAEGGEVRVDRIDYFSVVLHSSFYDVDGKPFDYADMFRNLNKSVAVHLKRLSYIQGQELSALPGMYHDQWMSGQVRSAIVVPGDIADRKLRIRTFAPTDWPEKSRIKVQLDGQPLGEVEIKPGDQTTDLPIKMALKPESVIEVTLQADSMVQLGKYAHNSDARWSPGKLLGIGFIN